MPPVWQTCEDAHAVQSWPPAPHATRVVPSWHCPLPSQQPEQVEELHGGLQALVSNVQLTEQVIVPVPSPRFAQVAPFRFVPSHASPESTVPLPQVVEQVLT